MNLMNRFLIAIVPCSLFVACGASPEKPSNTETVEIVPTASSASPPATAAAAASSKPEVAPAADKCLFCARHEGTCRRPKIATADLVKVTCGMYSQGGLSEFPKEDCSAECCPVHPAGKGDKDGDGIFDENDKCPDAPEDVDGNRDHDGCADPDNDADGLKDVDDMCCFVAEDKDGNEDLDGCPEP